jgi:hypothetical protein
MKVDLEVFIETLGKARLLTGNTVHLRDRAYLCICSKEIEYLKYWAYTDVKVKLVE